MRLFSETYIPRTERKREDSLMVFIEIGIYCMEDFSTLRLFYKGEGRF